MQNTKLQNINAEEVLEELRKTKVKTNHAVSSVEMLSKDNVKDSAKISKSRAKKAKNTSTSTETFSHSGLNLLKPFFSGKLAKYLALAWAFIFGSLVFYQVNLNINNASLDNNVSASTNPASLIITSVTGDRFYNILNMKIPENLLVAILTTVILGIVFLVLLAYRKLRQMNTTK